jgi:hypothetical protein
LLKKQKGTDRLGGLNMDGKGIKMEFKEIIYKGIKWLQTGVSDGFL